MLRDAGVLEQLLTELGAHLGALLESEYVAAAAFVPFLEGLLAQEPDQAHALRLGVSLLQPIIPHSQACMHLCPCLFPTRVLAFLPAKAGAAMPSQAG